MDEIDGYTENRANLYRLLAAVYRREPTADVLTDMKTSGLLSVLSDAGYDLTPLPGTGGDSYM